MRALYAGTEGWKNDLTNSLVLNNNSYLRRVPTVTGNRRQFTILMNVRRTTHDQQHWLFSAGTSFYYRIQAGGKIEVGGVNAAGAFVSDKVVRDTEWFFLGLAYDSVAQTIKVVMNDEELTGTFTLPSVNYQTNMNLEGANQDIGTYNNNASNESNYCISDVVILDGEVLTPQEMVNYRTQNVPFGNNVITTTKKFTTEGQQERFYTLSSNVPGVADVIINNEGQFIKRNTVGWASIGTEILPQTGLFQVEYELLDTGNLQIFIGEAKDVSITGAWSNYTTPTGIYAGGNAFIQNDSGTESGLLQNPAPVVGQIISVQLNLTIRKLYYSLDGVPQLGDPASGTGGLNIQSGEIRLYNNMHSLQGARVNFGQQDYAYPAAGYAQLKEPAKSDLKRCKLQESGAENGWGIPLKQRQLSSENTQSGWRHACSNFVLNSGKIYIEHKCGASDIASLSWGVIHDLNQANNFQSNLNLGHYSAKSIGFYLDGADHYHQTYGNTGASWDANVGGGKWSGAHRVNETTKIAIDFDAGLWWYGSDNEWVGDPSEGTGGLAIPTGQDWKLWVSAHTYGGGILNFGDTSWEHAPPTGFKGPAEFDFDSLRSSQDARDYEYGPNGCQILFENGGALGAVTAGNLVDWTLMGITSDDQLTDTPGDPYAVLSASATFGTGVDVTRGGLRSTASGGSDDRGSYASLVPSHKMYCEAYFETSSADNNGGIGLGPIGIVPGETSDSFRWMNASSARQGGVSTALGTNITVGQTIMIAFDPETGNAWIAKQGAWIGGGDPAAGTNPTVMGLASDSVPSSYHYNTSAYIVFNFGQKAFNYTPPTGFIELKSSNLETPKYHGRDKFDVALSVGTGAPRDIDTSFDQIGLVWGKARSSAYSHRLEDRLRGAGKGLYSDIPNAENTRLDSLTYFSSGSFSLGNDVGSGYNQNGVSYAYWIFGNDGTEVTNKEGTIPSQIIADNSGYMSLITFTGTGVSGDTIGHGGLKEPDMLITKNLTKAASWVVYNSVDGPLYFTQLDANGSRLSGYNVYADTAPTNSVFSTGGGLNDGEAGSNYVSYAIFNVPGLCKVGGYPGNGSVNGHYEDCGFRPRFIMIKQLNSSRNWLIYDTEINQFNPINMGLYADLNNSESSSSTRDIDITARGFKVRATANTNNVNGGDFLFLAIADVAGGGNLPAILGN
ncbi:hypothetical protein [Kiloniella sp.]|uniref:DUF7483 domain-containing protein n=1 Tax=Kiloniella sp. TaxID=1938587 RepID=UPI003A912B60